jgi:hypothetical protein
MGWPDKHGQVVIDVDLARGTTDGVPDVSVADAMLSGRLADLHPNATSCLHTKSTSVV